MCTSLWNLNHCHALPLFLLLHILFSPATAQPQNIGPQLPEDPFGNLTFDRTMTRLLVILVVAIFLFGFVSIYTRQCMERRTTGRLNFAVPITNSNVCLPPRGLDQETIENFPNFVYSDVKGLKIGRVTLECAVCLNEFADDETLRLIPKCSHVFHRDCIDIWLVNHSTCPVCRAILLPKPDGVCSSVAIDISGPRGLGTNLPESENNRSVNAVSRVDLDDCNRIPVATESSRVDIDEMNRPTRSKSTGFEIARLFSRSHSMGRRDVDCERFTLRLPEEVQNRLVKSVTKSWSVTMPSGRRGYRTRSVGRSNLHYERFDEETRLDRRGFVCTPPVLGGASSMRSNKEADKAAVVVDEDDVGVGDHSSDRLFSKV